VIPRHAAGCIAVTLALLTLGGAAASAVLVTPWAVAGNSMGPVLRPGDLVLVDRWTYRQREPRVAEVVLLVGPGGVPLIKRVAAHPEERAGHERVWVEGDNAGESADSRSFGPLPRSAVRGRVVWRYWPLSRAGQVR
jgi:signal peptidase I